MLEMILRFYSQFDKNKAFNFIISEIIFCRIRCYNEEKSILFLFAKSLFLLVFIGGKERFVDYVVI